MSRPRAVRAAALLLLLAAGLLAQSYRPGPQVFTFLSEIDDTDQPYGLYLPKNFDPARKYPLVVSLHGAWSNHRLNLRRVFGKGNLPGEGDASATRYFPPLPDVDFVVASPLARGTLGYQGVPEKDVYDVLEDVKKRFPIDEDRVYLTGLSMGGGGTVWLGVTRPDIWAAIAPVCPAVPQEAEDLMGNLLNLPSHFHHGDADPAVPVETSRRWTRRLKESGASVEYTEYPGVKHNSWDNAYRDAAVFEWFSRFRRNRFPERVRFATRHYKYAAAYWVKLDGLTPGTLASADARFTAPNRVEVTTSNLAGFTLSLAGHPRYNAARPLEIQLDGSGFKLKPGQPVSFHKTGSAWQPGLYTPPPQAKRAGSEGPLAEAFTGRHIYVYGTEGSPGEEEIRRRRDQAAAAADWSTPRVRLLYSPRVLADREVTEADLAGANLVLFGTRETNRLIARWAASLPIQLNAGAADYGLVYTFPVEGRYLLINSGLPLSTGAGDWKRPNLRFLSPTYRSLRTLPDFVLFRGSIENIVAEGHFDAEWKLAPADAARLKATGAVEVKAQ